MHGFTEFLHKMCIRDRTYCKLTMVGCLLNWYNLEITGGFNQGNHHNYGTAATIEWDDRTILRLSLIHICTNNWG